uniref:SprT-like protease n=1 Tax=Mycobacterium phage Pharb TaxID=3136626 RepID=A0AAU8GPP6_9VIRU
MTAAHMTPAEARKIAQALIAEHGLIGWSVVFDNARRRAGQCRYTPREISLSKPLMAQRSYADTWQTITHEIAHALVGSRHGHDAVWAAKHRSLGGNGKRCFEHTDTTSPWVGTCGHGKEFARYRQPKNMTGWRCKCAGGGSPITWARRGAPPVAPAPRPRVLAEVQAQPVQAPRAVGRGYQLGLF